MIPPVTIRTLTDGGQTAVEVAAEVAAFLYEAKRTLDLAQYDFELGTETAAIVAAAGGRAPDPGGRIRLAYTGAHRKPTPGPRPPSPHRPLIRSRPAEALAAA